MTRPGLRVGARLRLGAGLIAALSPAAAQDLVTRFDAAPGEKTLLIADLDGDGRAALVVAESETGSATIHRWRGGALSAEATLDVGANPTAIAIGDLDDDGARDLAFANHEKDFATIVFGRRADGAWAVGETRRQPINARPHAHAAALIDLNADGFDDLVIDSRDEDALIVMAGAPTREVGEAALYPIGRLPYLGFAIADLNADGAPDIAAPTADGVSIGLLERGGFAIAARVTLEAPDSFAVSLADFDGDGAVDLLSAGESGALHYFRGAGDGGFEERARFRMRGGAARIATGDVDGDGVSDAVIAAWSGDVRLFQAAGEAALTIVEHDLAAPWGVALGDLDGDGRAELALADAEGRGVAILSLASAAAQRGQ